MQNMFLHQKTPHSAQHRDTIHSMLFGEMS